MKLKKMLLLIMTLALLLTAGLSAVVVGAAEEAIAVECFDNTDQFDLYSSSAGGFQVKDGKLTPTGDAGEFKAIYKDNGQPIKAVSVEMHPNGNNGMYGGLYIALAVSLLIFGHFKSQPSPGSVNDRIFSLFFCLLLVWFC